MSQSATYPWTPPEDGSFGRVGLRAKVDIHRIGVSRYHQVLACCSAMLTMVTVGTVYGWLTTTLSRLKSGNSDVPLKIGQSEYSWITSLTVLGSMIGSLVCAQLADRIGRKYCLLVCSAIMTAGWFIIYVATSVRMLYFARVIHGIGVGIARTINPMYVSEVADIKIRGMLGTLITVAAYAGTMLTCTLENWQSYESLVVTLMIISLITLLLNTCFPKTPYFLAAKGRRKKARKSVKYYKSILDSKEVTREIRALRAQTRYELHPQSRYELDQQYRNDLPLQSRSDLPLQSRSDLPSRSRSNLTPQSRSERLSDPIQQVDTEPMSDLHSASCRHVPAIYFISSEVPCAILQQPRSESRLQAARALYLQHTSELQLRARSDLRRQSNVYFRPWELYARHMDGTICTGFTKLKCILHRSNKKALFIMFGLIMTQQIGKHFMTMQYPEKLYKEKNIVSDSYTATRLVQAVNILSSFCTIFIVDAIGRRIPLILSTLGTSATLFALAYYLLTAEYGSRDDIFGIPLEIVLIIYQVTFQIGLGTIPTVLLRELFPMELRGFVGAISIIFDGIIELTLFMEYQLVADIIEAYAVYHIFATLCAIASVMAYRLIPETKGKAYNEIKALLDGEDLHSSNE